MTYIPKKENKTRRLSFWCIISGILVMGLSSLIPYRAILQLAAIVLVIIGIQLLVRFVLSDYRYIINDCDDGTAELLVYKKQGRQDTLVCRISLSAVIENFDRENKKPQSDKCYNYMQNPGAKGYSLIFMDGEKRTEIIIEPDTVFINAINARIGVGEGDFTFVM